MAATMAFMIASLISKLSLRQEDELIDLGFPGKGFIAPRFYLVGKLNFIRIVQFDSFRSAVCAMWRLFVPVEVKIRDLPAALITNATVRLVGEMIGTVLQVDREILQSVQIREVPPFPSLARVAGVRRGREEDEAENGKREKHSLAIVPLALNPEDLGYSMAVGGDLGITKTWKSLKKRGRPRGSRNKKQLFKGETLTPMVAPDIPEAPSADETGGK
ncbi:hypothetical protein ACLB2K_023000 [Fragaria x ananassa]